MEDIDKRKVTIRLEVRQLETIQLALSVSNWPGAQDLANQIRIYLKRVKDEEAVKGLERIFGKVW